MRTVLAALALALTVALALALTVALPASATIEIPYTKHVLDNGLEVILHEDHSDPIVAVYVYYHVGSGREEQGRSGFAHLFEHVLFQGSEHVPDEQHFKLIQEAGGTANGSTTSDRTNYYEVLPSNQLELALWLESDRMGFLLPAVTQEQLDLQRDVVKNERRQNYENRPYAQARGVIASLLYPPDHPYSWTTIGSMDDLSAATLDDVKGFFQRWYGPNNATLAIGGDIDPAQALALVRKYFGTVPRGPEVAAPRARPTTLTATKRGVMEDRVRLPELSVTWPTVEMGHPDEAALDMLASVLSANKSSVLEKALRVDEPLASSVSAWHSAEELAGTFSVTLRPQPGTSLDVLEGRLQQLLHQLAADGVDGTVLERAKTSAEARLMRRLETVSSRTRTLANDNTFFGDPGRATKELAAMQAVTPADVMRVLRQHVLDRPAVVMSVVPQGQLDLAATGQGVPAPADALDRTQVPGAGPRPEFRMPLVWHSELANGVEVVGTPFEDVPLVTFTLSVPAGRLHETLDTLGLASLTASMLDEGTKGLTASDLAAELDGLGARLSIGADDDEIRFSVSTLERTLPQTVALLTDILLEPRFADEDFARLKQDRLTALSTRADQVRTIASDAWSAVTYGQDDVRGRPDQGTPETVGRLGADDVRAFWTAHGGPDGARLTWVGAQDARAVRALLRDLSSRWRSHGGAREALVASAPPLPDATRIYLVDKPGAPQSEIRIGHVAASAVDDEYFPLVVANYPLGGTISSRISQNLREDKGYTYGARSSFRGDLHDGTFVASAGVRTDVTAESVTELLKEINGYLDGPTDAELATSRDALLQSMTRQYESTRGLSALVDAISQYDRPDDYITQRRELLRTIDRDRLAGLVKKWIHPDRLNIVVVGDASVVLEKLEALGVGPVVRLDVDGSPLPEEPATPASAD